MLNSDFPRTHHSYLDYDVGQKKRETFVQILGKYLNYATNNMNFKHFCSCQFRRKEMLSLEKVETLITFLEYELEL